MILALIAINISNKSGLPSLLLFLGLGIICSQLGVEFNNFDIAERFSTIALVVIMFYGGFGTNWKMGKPVFKEAVTLAFLGVVLTSILTGLFAHYVFRVSWVESMLIGSIVGSTDYASVLNILKSKNLNLKYGTASLLELESGSNDPSAFTMTLLFLSLYLGTEISVVSLIAKQVGLGLAIGFSMSFVVSKLLEYLDIQSDGLVTVFMFAMAIFTYASTTSLGGNGYLAVYLFGIIIGNKVFKGKRDIVYFFDGFTELMNIALFFLLGLLATPARILSNIWISLAFMLFISLIARPASVFALMAPFKLKKNQLYIISWAGLKGAAAIAFAIMVVNTASGFSLDIFHIVFGICLLSSLFQGSLMPYITKKLDMMDPNDSVLRTFNYYVDKGDLTFMKTKLDGSSKMVGKRLMDLNVRGEFVVAKIIRDDKSLVPTGDVVLKDGDVLVVMGEEYFDPYAQDLMEFTITDFHPWANKKLKDLHLPKNELVLSVNREGNLLIAEGRTEILVGDRIILFRGTDKKLTKESKIGKLISK